MYQDIAVSKNLADKFREKIDKSGTPLESDFRIKVLTHGCWPFTNDSNVNLPIELTPIIDRFMGFYTSQHTGRRLMWQHKLSKTELVMNGLKRCYYVKVKQEKINSTLLILLGHGVTSMYVPFYFMQANTLQTAVLLHYNDQPTYSVQQLIEYTAIDPQYMILLLESMIKMKLMKRSDQSQEALSETSNIEINTDYNEYVYKFIYHGIDSVA